jgi:uncharacterized protein
MKRKSLILLIVLLSASVVSVLYFFYKEKITFSNKIHQAQPKPLLAYTFENLKKTKFPKSNITIGPIVTENADQVSRMFYFSVPQRPNTKDMEKVSGVVNIPKTNGKHPLIVMFRGFVPDNIYKPGIGTQPSAKVFANKGFITLAPDFLGFGQSASPSADPFENRFQTYTTALTLLSSLSNVNLALDREYQGTVSVDLNKIGIWGHSNGGHIALAALEISGINYPTVLWAPVSASFPYSILYYTNESDDQGEALRKTLAIFENIYDTDQFSLTNYYNWIKAPIQINQGENDHEVPVWWSDDLVEKLKKDDISVQYFTYPQADHNLLPSSWSDAVSNSINFYNREFSKQ